MKPNTRQLLTAFLFVAQICRASDALDTWTFSNSVTNHGLDGIVFGNGLFVTVGGISVSTAGVEKNSGLMLTSSNGFSWTKVEIESNLALVGIAFGDGIWMALGKYGRNEGETTSTALLTSLDGITWRTKRLEPKLGLWGLAYGNGRWVAGGWAGAIFSSANGVDWTQCDSGTTNIVYSPVYGNGQWLALSGSPEGMPNTSHISLDGTTWLSFTSRKTNAIYSPIFAKGQFVAFEAYSRSIFTSGDGIVWTSHKYGSEEYLNCLAYGDNQFLAVARSGAILTSPDAITWTQRKAKPNADFVNDIAYGNGKWVAVGFNRTTDGVNGMILVSGPNPIPPLPAPVKETKLQLVRLLSDGTVQGTVTGNAGQSYLIQSSTNLVDWLPLEILTSTTNATVHFTDRSATNYSRRFYRTVSP